MEDYAPKSMELAPRDIVARSIQTEIKKGFGFDNEYVHLDLRHLGAAKIKKRLPSIRDICIYFAGFDPIDSPIPIQPAQHYSMGGIDVNEKCASDVEGFYAAGECSCISVHGANRLGTNSLLGASVFGRRAGHAMAEFVKGGAQLQPVTGDPAERQEKHIARLMDDQSVGGKRESPSRIADRLKATMTKNCGVFRDAERLTTALQDVKALQERFGNARIMDKSRRFNTDLLCAIETEHLLAFSEVVVASGLARTESRGAHYRTDYRQRDDENWLHHTLAHKDDDGPRLSYKSVNIDWDKYPPQERKY